MRRHFLLELARQTALPDDEEYTRNSRAAHLKRIFHEDDDGQQNRFVDLDDDVSTEDHGLVYNSHDGLLESAKQTALPHNEDVMMGSEREYVKRKLHERNHEETIPMGEDREESFMKRKRN